MALLNTLRHCWDEPSASVPEKMFSPAFSALPTEPIRSHSKGVQTQFLGAAALLIEDATRVGQ